MNYRPWDNTFLLKETRDLFESNERERAKQELKTYIDEKIKEATEEIKNSIKEYINEVFNEKITTISNNSSSNKIKIFPRYLRFEITGNKYRIKEGILNSFICEKIVNCLIGYKVHLEQYYISHLEHFLLSIITYDWSIAEDCKKVTESIKLNPGMNICYRNNILFLHHVDEDINIPLLTIIEE